MEDILKNFFQANINFFNAIQFVLANAYLKNILGEYIWCNDQQIRSLGCLSLDQVVGKSDYAFKSQKESDFLREIEIQTIKTGKIVTVEESGLLENGKEIFYSFKKIPLVNQNGSPIGIIGLSFDVASQGSEQTLSEIIRMMPGHIYWKNREGVYLGCNDLQAQHLGFENRLEIIGKTDFEITADKKMAEIFRDNDLRIIENGLDITVEEKAQIGDTIAIMLSHKAALRDTHDDIVGMVGISVDITERKELEEKLRETEASEARFKALSAMGGMIAHELRTPLMGIGIGTSFVEEHLPILLKTYEEWSKEKNNFSISRPDLVMLHTVCNEISQSLAQVENTIDTILASFRPMPASEAKLTVIAMDEIIEQLLLQYPLTQQERALITVKKSTGSFGKSNPHVILHILTNLLKNSLYFIQEMGKGSISIWVSETVDKVHLHFQDTAKGIPNEKIDQIFELFYTTKDTATSIGVGLYYCKMAIENIGGQIICESEEGKFTEFTLILPRVHNEA
ncbi:MAG: hypothetical protein A3F17_09260 [Gammaproteobacteria bacterium RIFCSPHIGHO2_12_FULL_41_15]|nr:MAG: hypothetical protein A3F17_09260 [Gammaproteobacteria bacterium RIFCSPHIGHO2_12_FULL_41_15]